MDVRKFKSLLAAHGETQKDLAQCIGMGLSALNDRINGKKPFRQDEMNAIKLHYRLSAEQMVAIFFADELS